MKYAFSSLVTRYLRQHHRVATLIAVLTLVLTSGAFTFAPAAYAASEHSMAPTPPPGFMFASNASISQLGEKDSRIHVESIKLSTSECAAVNTASPAIDPNCQGFHYWTGANNLPLPRGTNASPTAVPPGWTYWQWSDKICGPICSVWSLTLSEDGVANGDSVWQWNEDCSEGGVAKVTWCGYFYNGGGAPHFAMQFGLNGKASLLGISYAHGMRRWIDDNGDASTFSKW